MALSTNIYAKVVTTFPARVSASDPIAAVKSGGVWTFTFDAANMALNSIPLEKIEQVPTDRLLGRDTADTGTVETLTVAGGLEFNGSGGLQTSAFTGDVTKPAGGTAMSLAANAVVEGTIADGSVTDAKLGSSGLRAISVLTPNDNHFIVGDGASWVTESGSTVRSSLGLAIGSDVQAFQSSQATTAWESGTGTTESVVSPAKIAAAIAVLGAGNTGWTVNVINGSNASWPVPPGTKEIALYVWGAGASGAGGDTDGGGQRGPGGGGGGLAIKYYSGTMDTTLNVQIGLGGEEVASAPGGAAGNSGGNSSVSGTNLGSLTGFGGVGPGAGATNGGTGGTATGGDINLTGGAGRTAQAAAPIATHFVFEGGDAAGWGGKGGKTNVGNPGAVPGGGGCCGNHIAASNSGAGADGQVVILTRG